jgi:hypothetical protein
MSDTYDNNTVDWCDDHAIGRSDCGCQAPGDAGLLQAIKSGTWLDEQQFAPVRYAIPHLIPEGYTVLVGPPKAGKSWLILDGCLAVATGGRALGAIDVEQTGPVLYLALEDGDARLQSRIRTLRPGQPIPEQFHYATEIEHGAVIRTVKAWMKAHPDTVLIALDTLGKVMPPAARGETTYERDYRVGTQLKRITGAHPGLALVVVHHDRKARTGDFVDSVSGTNGVAGAADTIVALGRERMSDEGVLSVTGRDIAETEFAIVMTNGTTWNIAGDSLADAQAHAREVRQEIRAAQHGPLMQQVVEFVRQSGDGVRAQQVADQLGIDKGKAAVYLKRASEARLIDRLERGLYGPIMLTTSYVNVYEVLDLDDSSNTSNTLSVSPDEIPAVVA